MPGAPSSSSFERVLDVGGDRARERVRGRGRRREAVRHEQDPARARQQRRAGTGLVGRRQRGLVEAAGDGRDVDRRDVQAGLGEAGERSGACPPRPVDAAQDPVGRRPGLVVARVQRPQALGIERRLGVAADRGDRVARRRRAPLAAGERLVGRGVVERLYGRESTQ